LIGLAGFVCPWFPLFRDRLVFGEAVIVFFMLSGYLVGGIASARASAGNFAPWDYAIDRFTRLYLAFLPALALTAVLDAAGSTWFPGAGLYTHGQAMLAKKVDGGAFIEHLTPSLFVANALMMQTIKWPAFGSNDPLWTISLEFWFYVVFSALASPLGSRPAAGSARSASARSRP
jgi:peptidoglycan/LPS O-acetylase OafA/YrhL